MQLDSSAPIALAEWRENQERFFGAFDNAHHVIEDHISEGDRLVTRCRFEGVHARPFADIEPTGAAISVRATHIDRFHDGQLIEHHGQLDTTALAKQLGASR